MNATKRSFAGVAIVGFSVLAVAVSGCRTKVIHQTRTVYVPAPSPVVTVQQTPVPPPPPTIVLPPPQPFPSPATVIAVAPEPLPQPATPVVVIPPPEPAPVVIIQSENDFYEPLAAYGRWVVVGPYGRVWIPARVESGWRPYSNGYWQRTDAGWYWASDEPWGWATYHYGRWDFDAHYGWIWVPQTQWAPAWVAWREGGGYVGWAPLRPSVGFGVNVRAGDYEPAFASRAFVFVEQKRMLEPVRPKTVVVNNTTIINKTVNITNVRVENKRVINEGPRADVIARESGREVRAVPVNEFRHREETRIAARDRNIPTRDKRKETATAPARSTPIQPIPSREIRTPERPNLPVPPGRLTGAPVRPNGSESVNRPIPQEGKRQPDAVKAETKSPAAPIPARPEVPRVSPLDPRATERTSPIAQPVVPSRVRNERNDSPAISNPQRVGSPVAGATNSLGKPVTKPVLITPPRAAAPRPVAATSVTALRTGPKQLPAGAPATGSAKNKTEPVMKPRSDTMQPKAVTPTMPAVGKNLPAARKPASNSSQTAREKIEELAQRVRNQNSPATNKPSPSNAPVARPARPAR